MDSIEFVMGGKRGKEERFIFGKKPT